MHPPNHTPGPALFATTVRVRLGLDPRILPEKGVKKGAPGWTDPMVHHFVQQFVAPSNPSSIPI